MKLTRDTFEEFLSFGNSQFPKNLIDKGDCWDHTLDGLSINKNTFDDTISFHSVGTCRSQWGDCERTEEDAVTGAIDVDITPKQFIKLEDEYEKMYEWCCDNDYDLSEVRFYKKKKQLYVQFIVETPDTFETWEYKI